MATILVVDDDPQASGPVVTWLKRKGHEIVLAVDGQDGLDAFRRVRPPVAIVDIHLPDMDGFSVVETMWREAPGMGIIVMSGAVDERLLNMARGIGAVATLPKPFLLEDLDKAVDTALRASRRMKRAQPKPDQPKGAGG